MMMMQPVLVNPRRMSAVASGHAELAVSGLALPPNVIRLPRGPDKGKGFQRWCKTRMQPASAPQAQQAESAPKPVQRKSRAIPIVAPPAAAAVAAEAAAEAAAPAGAVGGAEAPAPAPAAPNNNLVVNLESSDSDEGHFSDHDLDVHENERTR